jgi:hypothetical protein
MSQAKLLTGFAVMIGALLLVATPAFAEFESTLKVTKGKGELIEIALEAGGAVVTCQAFTEGAGTASWTIRTAQGKEATNGTKLLVKPEVVSECLVKSSKIKQAKAAGPACEFELIQAHQERRIPLSILGLCQFVIHAGPSIASCNITLGASNRFRNSVSVTSNAILQPSLTNVITNANSTNCNEDNIASSEEGELTGVWEMKGVQVQPLAELVAAGTRLFYNEKLSKGSVTITNKGVEQSPRSWLAAETPAAAFEPVATEEVSCKKKLYGSNEACLFGTLFLKAGWQVFEIQSANGGWSGVVLRG